MGRYLVLWDVDSARVPTDAKERGTAWLAMLELTGADMKKGSIKDWGSFAGELKGYSVMECTEAEIMQSLMQYAPYIKFEVHAAATLSQAQEAIKAAMK